MSDFMELARATADKRWPHIDGPKRPADWRPIDWLDSGMGSGFVLGALWARDVLLADPTDGEVEAVARVIYEQTDWSGCEGSRWELVRDREDFYPLARAAIDAFLAERRESE